MFILYVYALSEPQDFFSFLFFKVHQFKTHCQGGSIIIITFIFANYYFYYFHFRLQRKDKDTFI